MLDDVRRACRALGRAPGFSLSTLLTLAVGLGTTYAVLTVIHAVLLRPLPYADPDRLFTLLHDGRSPVSPANYFDYRQSADSFELMTVAQAWGTTISSGGDPERLTGLGVSAETFDLLGVPAARGRTFLPGEDEPGRNRVVVVSHGLWQRRFGGDAAAIGRNIVLDGEPHEIVGVMPPEFYFAPFWITDAELWRPLDLSPRVNDRGGQSLRIFARLRRDRSPEAAQAQVSAAAERLARDHPVDNAGLGLTMTPLYEKTVGPIRPTLVALAVMALFVLLVACGNAAALQVVRGTARTRDTAVRAALGAGRRRLAREMAIESAILGIAGGALGLLVAAWAIDLLRVWLPAGSLPRQAEIAVRPAVLLMGCALAVLAGTLAGLAPALMVGTSRLADALRDSGRATTESRGARHTRRLLLGAQLAFATTLLAGAALMGRTLLELSAVQPGFNPAGVLAFTVALAGTEHDTDAATRLAAFESIERALRALPGAQHVGAINHLPLAGDTWRFRFLVDGRPAPPRGEEPRAVWRVVTPGYFEAMQLDVLRGRALGTADDGRAPGVAVVNATMARRHWPDGDTVGRRIRIGVDEGSELLTIVGVVADARQDDWTGAVGEEIHVPYAQHAGAFGGESLTWIVRTGGSDPAALAGAARRAVWSVDRGLPIVRLATLEDVIAEHLWRPRITGTLLGIFAAAALTLAALGVYGVSAYAMRRRTREIGIRLALGARTAHVASLIGREVLTPVAGGVAVGCALATALSRLLESLLYGVAPADPYVYAAAALALSLLAIAAASVPMRRASRIDPLLALREE